MPPLLPSLLVHHLGPLLSVVAAVEKGNDLEVLGFRGCVAGVLYLRCQGLGMDRRPAWLGVCAMDMWHGSRSCGAGGSVRGRTRASGQVEKGGGSLVTGRLRRLVTERGWCGAGAVRQARV
jgi:hypothetical protein